MDVKPGDIQDLLEFFSKNTYKARDTHPAFDSVMQRCLHLFGLDYVYSVIPNVNGELSTNYPSNLVILEREKSDGPISENDKIHCVGEDRDLFDLYALDELQDFSLQNKQNGNGVHVSTSSESSLINHIGLTRETNIDTTKLKDLFSKARFARCRARFPVPVILYKTKHICRSATLSGGPEIYGRSSLDYFFSGNNDYKVLESDQTEEDLLPPETQSDWQLFDRVRSQDIRLLKSFQVQTIVDLMVEKKKVKFGVNVTSSEKVDKEKRYADFNLISLPYPGCEFFKQYRDNDYNGEDLIFEWNQGHVDADIFIPEDPIASGLSLDWSQYRNWDLVCLTQNYLKLLLEYIRNGSSGLLIHCISGWDRTPLFVSLLRLSLWADGAAHKSLNAEQILYLTLAYDWLLFGHNLEDRLSKGEEILFFCFYFLKHITDHEFSIQPDELEPEDESCSTEPAVLSTSRNDSDIHLEGVLLEAEESHTSPNCSSWSLNSSGSSQSSQSHDQPPTYFTVNQDSWEDACGSRGQPTGPKHEPAVLPTEMCTEIYCNTSKQPSASYSNGNRASVNGGKSYPLSTEQSSSSNNISSNHKSTSTPGSCFSPSVMRSPNTSLANRCGRTSPVPVPKGNHQNRTDSNSSASIGSWQLISGIGSLRENVSSSDPGSAYSHVSRSSVNDGMDCVEASESSCTLVDELNAATSTHMFTSSAETYVQDRDSPIISPFQFHATVDNSNVFVRENGNSNGISSKDSSAVSSRRKTKLQAVRTHFNAIYSCAIKRHTRLNGNEGGGSGLSVLIGNIATKVGIRAPARNMS